MEEDLIFQCEQIEQAHKARPDIPELKPLLQKAGYLRHLLSTEGEWSDEVVRVSDEIRESFEILSKQIDEHAHENACRQSFDFSSGDTVERLMQLFDDQVQMRADYSLRREPVTTPKHLIDSFYDQFSISVRVPRLWLPESYQLRVVETVSDDFEQAHFDYLIKRFPQEFGKPIVRMPLSTDMGNSEEQGSAIQQVSDAGAVVVVDSFEYFEYPSSKIVQYYTEISELRRMVRFTLQVVHDSPRVLKKK